MGTRVTGATAAVALSLSGLAGCSTETEAYCDELQERQQTLTELADRAGRPGTDVLGESLEVFQDLRDAAPDDVSDEWTTFVFAWEAVVEAYEDRGSEAGGSDRLEDAAAELASERVAQATTGIEQHALDVCGVDLTEGGLP